MLENKTLIGILLIKLELTNEDSPYLTIKLSWPKKEAIYEVTPCLFNARTMTNIETIKGIKVNGKRIKVL